MLQERLGFYERVKSSAGRKKCACFLKHNFLPYFIHLLQPQLCLFYVMEASTYDHRCCVSDLHIKRHLISMSYFVRPSNSVGSQFDFCLEPTICVQEHIFWSVFGCCMSVCLSFIFKYFYFYVYLQFYLGKSIIKLQQTNHVTAPLTEVFMNCTKSVTKSCD